MSVCRKTQNPTWAEHEEWKVWESCRRISFNPCCNPAGLSWKRAHPLTRSCWLYMAGYNNCNLHKNKTKVILSPVLFLARISKASGQEILLIFRPNPSNYTKGNPRNCQGRENQITVIWNEGEELLKQQLNSSTRAAQSSLIDVTGLPVFKGIQKLKKTKQISPKSS